MPTLYPAVKDVLDKIIANWTKGNNDVAPDFVSAHGSAFPFDTRDGLMGSSARGLKMIQQELIGVPGQGHNANIVLALTVGAPKPNGGAFPKMPDGGLDSTSEIFLTLDSPEIKTIIAWIEDGCLPVDPAD